MDRRRALVWKGYKLIAFGDDKNFLLFDVAHDPAEQQDLATKDPDRFASMKKLYNELSAEIPVVPVKGGVALRGAPPSQRW